MSTNNLRVFYSKIRLHWGFVVRAPGATAAQIALPVPPPTTIVGAFTDSILRTLEIKNPTSIKASKDLEDFVINDIHACSIESTIASTFGVSVDSPSGLAVLMEAGRIIASPYKTGGEVQRIKKAKLLTSDFYENIGRILPVQAVGASYGPGVIANIAWVIDLDKFLKCLGNVNKEVLDKVGLLAAYNVKRIGSKEGLVSVLEARYGRVGEVATEVKTGEKFKANNYIYEKCVEPLDRVSKITLWDLKYRWERYYVPLHSSDTLVVPTEPPEYRLLDCNAYKILGTQDTVIVG